MRTSSYVLLGRAATLMAALGLLFTTFLLIARPWYVTWGATPPEASAALPGDDLLPASSQTTRAVTIDAASDRVWAWIAQLGRDRGGFYSYEVLENLVGARIHNIDELRPALQQWTVGDKLWMYPAEKLDGAGHAVLLRLDPGRALVFGTRQIGTALDRPPDGSWTFVVAPLDANHTRLIARGRASGSRSLALSAFDVMVFEPMHFVMERKMLEGIKQRAEGTPPSRFGDLMEVAAFAACFMLLIAASVRVIAAPSTMAAVSKVVAAGLGFQLLTFAQPPWVLGCVAVAMLGFYVGSDLPAPRGGDRKGAPRGTRRSDDATLVRRPLF